MVILGTTGWNFGAGMSGGEAFVLDPAGIASVRFNGDSVVGGAVVGEAGERLRSLIARHATETGSPLAQRLIEGWPEAAGRFTHVLPRTERQAAVSARRGRVLAANGRWRTGWDSNPR